jgi:hypothetical protein
MTAKRLIVCTLLGGVAGVLCYLAGRFGGNVPPELLTVPMALGTIFNRAFIGFAIGISGWRARWAFHGVVIGLVGSLPLSVYALSSPANLKGFLLLEFAGGVWGLLIELGAIAVGARKR